MPKSGLPVTIVGLSTPGDALADDPEVLRVLELHRSRLGRRDLRRRVEQLAVADCVRSPRGERRPTRSSHSAAGTFHVAAAAATSIARAAAPTWRIGSQLVGVAVLPPANWPLELRRVEVALLDA